MQLSVYKDPYSKAYMNSASMNIDANRTNQLNNTKINRPNFKDIQKDIQKELETETESLTKNPNQLLSSSERNYFKKLFPENAEQIDKHIVFNRNARVQSQSVTKGMIIDGRI